MNTEEPHGSLDYPPQTEIEPVHQEPLSLSYEELALRIDKTDKTRKFSRETSPTSDTQSRLSSTSSHHFALDRDLLRGIPLKATLHGFGKMWTTSPTDLPDDDTREALWTKPLILRFSKAAQGVSQIYPQPYGVPTRRMIVLQVE